MKDDMLSPIEIHQLIDKNQAKQNLHIPEKSLVIRKQEKLREKFADLISKDLPPQPSIIEFRDKEGNEWPLILRKSITSITGKKGSHKTRMFEGFLAIVLADKEYAGVFRSADLNESPFIIWVDTERDQEYQFPEAMQKVFGEMGNKFIIPDNIELVSLTVEPRQERLAYVKEVVHNVRMTHENQAIFLAIDVSTDMINNFNDPVESMLAIDYLTELINTYDVTILLVIHQNPGHGDSKQGSGRGHFGTELANKSTTEIAVSYDRETKVVTANITKARKIPPGLSFAFKYNRETEMIEALSEVQKEIVIGLTTLEDLVIILPEVFGSQKSMLRKDIIEEIIERNGGSEANHRKNIDKVILGEHLLRFDAVDPVQFKKIKRLTHKGMVYLELYDE